MKGVAVGGKATAVGVGGKVIAVGVGGNVTAVGVGGRVIAVGVGSGGTSVGAATGVLIGSEAVHAIARNNAAETTASAVFPNIELVLRMYMWGNRSENAAELYAI